MLILDAFFRFSGIGLLMMLALLTALNFPKWKSAPYLILTCISVSAVFLGFAPDGIQTSGAFYRILRLADVPHLVFLWLFALSLFQTNFSLRPFYTLIGLLYCAPLVWVRFEEFGWISGNPPGIELFISLLSLALMVHLCVTTLRSRKDDLVDKRRASRVYFVIIITIVTVISAVSEPLIPYHSDWKQTSKVLAIWPAIVWGFIWMTTFNKRAVTFASNDNLADTLSVRDKALKEKLETEMHTGLAFKDPDLNIVTLASRLGVTQHRLRSLINRTLGYKNFSAFVNAYRIDDVKVALTDPKNAHLPILTLALDCGFNSLSSFNRIFKLSENMTPTEYRNASKLSKPDL